MRIAQTLAIAALALPLSVSAYAEKPNAAAAGATEAGKRDVQIQVDSSATLAGTLYSPKGTRQGSPAVLLVHDAGGTRDDFKDVADKFNKQGFFVLALDLRGHGQSRNGETEFAKLAEDAQAPQWTAALADVKAGLAFLREQPGVQVASISLVGYRLGCSLVTRHTLRDEAVRSIVLIDPQPDRFGLSVMKDIEGLGGLPTLVVLPKGDDRSERRLVEAVAKATSVKTPDAMTVLQAKEDAGATLADKRISGEIVKWVQARVSPQKGKG